MKNAFKRALNFVFEVEFFMHNWHFQTQNRFWFNLTKNRHIFSLMAPKDGLEQPTTKGEPVELDVDTFAEVEEAIDRTPVSVRF